MTDLIHVPPSDGAHLSRVQTFLIADVRGYTRFTLDHGNEAAARLAAKFATLARESVTARGGEVVELRGDEALAVFSSPREGLRAAVELQDRFIQESGTDPSLPLRVGIGLDAGEAIPVEQGYRGVALNLASRLSDLAAPGEVLASDTVATLARKLDGLEYAERGLMQLKGFTDPVKVIQVVPEGEALSVMADPGPGTRNDKQCLPIGGFLGSLPSGPLVDREEEMTGIRGALDAVQEGDGRLVLLAGEPGAGKTRLAQEATLLARNRGFLLATGSCYESRQSIPYYPFLDALVTLYGAAPADVRAQMGARWPYLGRLLPEVGGPIRGLGVEGQEEQERLFRAITSFVEEIAAVTPVALLLDDLQWADGSTMDLILHLARHTRAHRVLILGAYRDVDVFRGHPLERALRDLHRDGLLQRISVQRLGREATAALVAANFGQEEVSSEFAELVYRHTEGNPFFTQEVLRALVDRGDIYRENDRWERRDVAELLVPESVRSVIAERLSRVSEAAQEMLFLASVLGQAFAFDDLQAMSGRSEDEVDAVLQEARDAGLVRETDRDLYSFNHALTQQALYAELSGRRKRKLHLAAGEALERLPEHARSERVSELAWHFLEGDDPERALRYALLAGDQATDLFARNEAQRHYRTAMDLAREIGDERRLADALLKLGESMHSFRHNEEAGQLLEESSNLYQRLNDAVMEARALATLAHVYGDQGDVDRGERAVERVERILTFVDPAVRSRDLARVYGQLGHYFFSRSRYSDQLTALDRATMIASELPDERLHLKAEVHRLLPLAMLGEYPEVRRAAESIIPRAEAMGELEVLQDAFEHIAEATTWSGEFERSRQYRERAIKLQERLGDEFGGGVCLANLSWLERLRGDWRAAGELGERALEIARSGDGIRAAMYPLEPLGTLAIWQGDWDRGTAYLEECISIAEPFGEMQFLRMAHQSLAERDLLAGHPEDALQRLEPVLDRPGLQEHNVTALLPTLAWAYLDLRDEERAREILAEGVQRATRQENRLALVDALRVEGTLYGRLGEREQAEASFRWAVALAGRMLYPYAEARALREWGRHLVEVGETSTARERLDRALTIFERLGARRDAERTRDICKELAA